MLDHRSVQGELVALDETDLVICVHKLLGVEGTKTGLAVLDDTLAGFGKVETIEARESVGSSAQLDIALAVAENISGTLQLDVETFGLSALDAPRALDSSLASHLSTSEGRMNGTVLERSGLGGVDSGGKGSSNCSCASAEGVNGDDGD